MKKKILFIIILLSFALILPFANKQVRIYISAQQQQDMLRFSSPDETSLTPTSIINMVDETEGTQQVDWVYDNLGRCWNAWSAPSCGLTQHEGGVVVPSMRDLDHDGDEDITCSQGGTANGTTITNTSDETITINCERYTCTSCTSSDGIHAQCDGGVDSNAQRIVETVELTPGCVATCTMQGVFGTCLEEQAPPEPTQPVSTSTPVPNTTNPPVTSPTVSPTNKPTATIPPAATNTPVPTQTPKPTNIPTIANPTATSNPARSHLPVAIDYGSYADSYNQFPPTYLYAMMNRTYNAQGTQRGIQGLSQINGNVVKMIMISEYNALEQILQNHGQELRAAGVTWIGYNAERDGRTPASELDAIFSPDPSVNVINKMGRLADQHGFKLMLGPVTPMWNEYFRRTDRDRIAQAMIGDNCYLDGIAFQEQKQISRTNKAERAQIISERTAFFRGHAQQCPEFESMVQLMSSWCQQNSTWEECRAYYHLLKDLEGPSRVNSLAIWASGQERNDLPRFIEFLRQ